MRWLCGAAALLLCSPVWAASATLSWTPPEFNTDGSAYADPAGYVLYAGCNQSGTYELTPAVINDPAVTSYVYEGLPYDATCFFAATAVNASGVESVYSNEATKILPALNEPIPGPVESLSVTWAESSGSNAMTGFSSPNSQSAAADPASLTLTAPTAGNLLVALISERSGTGSTPHTISDDNGNTWTPRIRHDQELADSGARHSLSVWTHIATSTDAAGNFGVSGDDGTTNTKRLTVIEVAPDAAYDFNFEVKSSADSGTGSTSPLSSGTTTDPGGSDLFVLGVAAWRNANDGVGFSGFTNLDSTSISFDGGTNDRTHAAEFATTGQASGGKETSVSFSSDQGHEAICGILVFSTGGGGGTTFEQAVAGSLTPTGAITRETQKALAGAVTPSGAITRQTLKAIAGTVSPAGTLARRTDKHPAGAVTPTGTVASSLTFSQAVAGALAPAGSLVRSTFKALAGAITPQGSIVRQTNKGVSGSVTPSGTISTGGDFTQAVAGALTPVGALIKSTLKSLAGALTPSGAVTRETQKSVTGSLTPQGTITRDTSKNVEGSVTPTGSLTASQIFLQAVAGALTPVGALTTQFIAASADAAQRSYRGLTRIVNTMLHGRR